MKNFLKKIKANALISAIFYTVLGAVLIAWPGTSATVLTTALGLVLVLCGLGNILDFLLHRDGSLYSRLHLIAGVILAVIGLWLTTQPNLLTVVVPRVMGILICIHGAGDIHSAFILKKNHAPRIGLTLLLALITFALGVLLVVNPFSAFTTIVRIIGLCLLYDGISDIWIALQVHQSKKLPPITEEPDTEVPQEFTDVSFEDVSPEAAEAPKPDNP